MSWGQAAVGGAAVVAAAIVAGVISWLIERRKHSGSVAPSDAASLWTAYDKVMARVEVDNRELREENRKLRERVAVLEHDVARMPELEREVERLRGIVNGV